MYKHQLMLALRFIIVCTAFIGFYLAFYFTFSFIYPILIAFILSYLLHPIVSILETRLKIPRPAATFFTMTGLFGLITAFFIAAISEVYQGTVFLAEKIPGYFFSVSSYLESFFQTTVIPLYEKILSLFSTLDPDQQQTVGENVQLLLHNMTSAATEWIQHLLMNVPALFSALPNSFTVILFIILATFIITNDWNKLRKSANKLLSKQIHFKLSTILHHLKKALGGYFKAQLTLIFISFLLILIGLVILGVDHALTIALLAGLVDLIPYVGIGIIFIPWIVYLFLQANYSLTIGLCLLYMIIAITRQVLEPKILSANIGVNPLAALIGMFLGIQLWGVFGLLVAPIILIVLSACHKAGVTKWIWNYVTG